MADVSKLNAYAVIGSPHDRIAIPKLTAYAVTNDAAKYISLSKLTAYAVVVESPAVVARPHVFVCT